MPRLPPGLGPPPRPPVRWSRPHIRTGWRQPWLLRLDGIEKPLAGEGFLAHVTVSKYVDHLPLYRLEQIFAREKIDLARTTLCEWVAAVAAALAPIGEQLRREITATDYLQTDDTSVTVLVSRNRRK